MGRNPSAYRCMDYMSSNRARCPIFRRLVPSLPSSPLLEVFKGGAAVSVVPPFTLMTNVPIALWLAGLSKVSTESMILV